MGVAGRGGGVQLKIFLRKVDVGVVAETDLHLIALSIICYCFDRDRDPTLQLSAHDRIKSSCIIIEFDGLGLLEIVFESVLVAIGCLNPYDNLDRILAWHFVDLLSGESYLF